jgi:hypothetical protein
MTITPTRPTITPLPRTQWKLINLLGQRMRDTQDRTASTMLRVVNGEVDDAAALQDKQLLFAMSKRANPDAIHSHANVVDLSTLPTKVADRRRALEGLWLNLTGGGLRWVDDDPCNWVLKTLDDAGPRPRPLGEFARRRHLNPDAIIWCHGKQMIRLQDGQGRDVADPARIRGALRFRAVPGSAAARGALRAGHSIIHMSLTRHGRDLLHP